MFQKMLENMAQKRKEQLDSLPGDIGGQIKGLKEYDFMDPDARQQFQELLDMLQQQMVQNTFSGLQQGMQQMQQDPAAMQATREMLQRPQPDAARPRGGPRAQVRTSSCRSTATSSRPASRTSTS